ncbi:MAG: hypothetical protein KKB82_04355 [Candidatus Omnitrophica bacterium]|nr:hypothetical protein [Candidatus Omnitrophota bacterium]MBU1925137.1 hypothetical protein [Candidatus Omnitrophota bacterium]
MIRFGLQELILIVLCIGFFMCMRLLVKIFNLLNRNLDRDKNNDKSRTLPVKDENRDVRQ